MATSYLSKATSSTGFDTYSCAKKTSQKLIGLDKLNRRNGLS